MDGFLQAVLEEWDLGRPRMQGEGIRLDVLVMTGHCVFFLYCPDNRENLPHTQAGTCSRPFVPHDGRSSLRFCLVHTFQTGLDVT